MQVGAAPYLFGLLASHFLLQGCDAFGCPSGWMSFQQYCYGVYLTEVDWTQAEMKCQQYGQSSHLVSILSETEAEAISAHLQNNSPDADSLWIGLQDRHRKGRWRWSDMSTSMFTAWEGGAPKKIDESGFCAYISRKQKFEKWNDAFCNTPMAFMCQLTI
ncbi:regenerating islet-derived protein 4-like [Paroedura picta]|uniref:regenerating islet-derived protein 4-like n=1 Tax=Paroedura picta TaxID=143630 RepID=UPI0040565318